jgi:hypothetical protein
MQLMTRHIFVPVRSQNLDFKHHNVRGILYVTKYLLYLFGVKRHNANARSLFIDCAQWVKI